MEVTKVLFTKSETPVVCFIDLLIITDFQMEESHGQFKWCEYPVSKEIVSMRFEKHGFEYSPTCSELRDWHDEIEKEAA